jgi:hypothetical protein
MQNSLEDDLIKNTQVSLAVEVRLPAVIIKKEERCCHIMLIFRRRLPNDIHISVHVLSLEVKWVSETDLFHIMTHFSHLLLFVHFLRGGWESIRRLICLSSHDAWHLLLSAHFLSEGPVSLRRLSCLLWLLCCFWFIFSMEVEWVSDDNYLSLMTHLSFLNHLFLLLIRLLWIICLLWLVCLFCLFVFCLLWPMCLFRPFCDKIFINSTLYWLNQL